MPCIRVMDKLTSTKVASGRREGDRVILELEANGMAWPFELSEPDPKE